MIPVIRDFTVSNRWARNATASPTTANTLIITSPNAVPLDGSRALLPATLKSRRSWVPDSMTIVRPRRTPTNPSEAPVALSTCTTRRWMALIATVQDPATVCGRLRAMSAIRCCCLRIAFPTRAEVSSPAAPMSLSLPTDTPNPSAINRASCWLFSRIERSSSPASLPEPSAWANCCADAAASAVLEPDALAVTTRDSDSRRASSMPPPSRCTAGRMRANEPTMSSYGACRAWDDSYSESVASLAALVEPVRLATRASSSAMRSVVPIACMAVRSDAATAMTPSRRDLRTPQAADDWRVRRPAASTWRPASLAARPTFRKSPSIPPAAARTCARAACMPL